jgi:hypothetical protein
MTARILKLSAGFGLLVGVIVSAAMTRVDWKLNPSGLFHNEHGTQWAVVTETAVSWLLPVSLATCLTTAIVLYSVGKMRSR